ncbi:MAG: hypothetical protein Q9160_005184 [Pyrenula sp. 1 TL-2023]
MSSAVMELDTYLQSMLNLKPPGVSGGKISSITSLCTANVQSESVLIQKIYTHFKKAPNTHKLGVLYVVDSVTRQWVDQARKKGQTPGSGASDGTFAAGVNRVTELLPSLMNDIIGSAPEDQKTRIKKLVDIWERGNTFPTPMLSSFKDKLNQNIQSTTPEGSPGPDATSFLQNQLTQAGSTNQQQPPPAQNTSAILATLANMAKQNASTPASAAPGQTSLNSILGASSATPQIPPSVDQAPSTANGQNVNPLGSLFSSMGSNAQNQNQPSLASQPNLLASLLPQGQAQAPVPPPNAGGLNPDALQQVQLLQLLAQRGIPQEQWATALQILNISNSNAAGGNANFGAQPPFGQAQANAWGARPDAVSRDRDEYMRSPPGGQYRRRSRSPGWERRREPSPPRRRDSPVYGDYHGDSPGRRDGRGRRGNEYRQRSPARRRRSPSPNRKEQKLPPPGPKTIEWDYSIGQGMIKVLSRTLFVGGVTSSEAHLRSLFSNYGIVQTCIVNIDKRHAFVKMVNRKDAVAARDGMEQYKSGDMQLRTRWGVGFGPRDCSDYQTGVSIIPVDRLTDADRKWMLTAEYGGTGGKAIEGGMVVEEPDIEIGAGVSSKAISRRMATDQGGKRGPQSSRGGNPGSNRNERGGSGSGGRNHDDREAAFGINSNSNGNNFGGDQKAGAMGSNNNIGVPPAVPNFGFGFNPNLPMFTNFLTGNSNNNNNPS